MEVVVITEAIGRAKAPAKLSPPTTNQHSTFHRPDAHPVSQPTVSKHWRENHIPWTCSTQAHLEVFQHCLWPLKTSGYLGEVCHASRQPSVFQWVATLLHKINDDAISRIRSRHLVNPNKVQWRYRHRQAIRLLGDVTSTFHILTQKSTVTIFDL